MVRHCIITQCGDIADSPDEWEELKELDALIYAVGHKEYRSLSESELSEMLKPSAVFADVKSAFRPDGFRDDISYWCL